MSVVDNDITLLEQSADSIVDRSLVRSTLVQPGPAFLNHPELGVQFEKATSLYKAGAFREAQVAFASLSEAAGADRPSAGFTAQLNAAACAAACKDWPLVVELLTPFFTSQRLYGHPLWNLALAWYHLGSSSKALDALELWVSRAFEWHRARGLLLISALALKSGDKIKGTDALKRAIDASPDFVAAQFKLPMNDIQRSSSVGLRSKQPLDRESERRLQVLLEPKRPERRPELHVLLSADDMETFTTAIEEIAEGRLEHAKERLVDLDARHPAVQHIRFAVGACELFMGSNERAKAILLPAIDTGATILGSALWNLACAQIRLGDSSGARVALQKCSTTEYKTKPQLWAALGILNPAIPGSSIESVRRQPQIELPTSPGRQTLEQRRNAQLDKLIRPKRLPSSYKPDITKLTVRDRQTVEQILHAARQADPPDAYSMLVPWITRYPSIYTLKVHGAAFALLAENYGEAARLLNEASEARPLDAVSRMNLAYVCLRSFDYLGVVNALEGGESYSMAERSQYWLALALARAASGQGDPTSPAAQALALSATDAARKGVVQVLAECEITPSSAAQSEVPAITFARRAQAYLAKGDLAGTAACLNEACGERFERVPEIGDRVFEPQFERLPDAKWSPILANRYLNAVKLYESERVTEAGEEFKRLHESSPRPRTATNLLAAYLKSGGRRTARSASRRLVSGLSKPTWQLYYNQALSQTQLDNGVSILERRLKDDPRGLSLSAALCRIGIDKPSFREKMFTALDRLRQSTVQPSLELLLAMAWTRCSGTTPDLEACRSYLRQVLDRPGLQTVIPPAEVSTMQQVRSAYQQLSQGGNSNDVLQYLSRVIEAREADRSEQRSLNLERNLGIELIARQYLVREYAAQNKRQEVFLILDQCEGLLRTHDDAIAPGFLAKDWHDLAKLSLEVGLPFAASRCVGLGQRIDPESVELINLRGTIESTYKVDEAEHLARSLGRLLPICESVTSAPTAVVVALGEALV